MKKTIIILALLLSSMGISFGQTFDPFEQTIEDQELLASLTERKHSSAIVEERTVLRDGSEKYSFRGLNTVEMSIGAGLSFKARPIADFSVGYVFRGKLSLGMKLSYIENNTQFQDIGDVSVSGMGGAAYLGFNLLSPKSSWEMRIVGEIGTTFGKSHLNPAQQINHDDWEHTVNTNVQMKSQRLYFGGGLEVNKRLNNNLGTSGNKMMIGLKVGVNSYNLDYGFNGKTYNVRTTSPYAQVKFTIQLCSGKYNKGYGNSKSSSNY